MSEKEPYVLKALAALNIGVAGYIVFGDDNSIGGPSWWRVFFFWFLIPTLALPVLIVLNPTRDKWELIKSTYGMFLFGPIIFGVAMILLPIFVPAFLIWLFWKRYVAKPVDENDPAQVTDLTWIDRLVDRISARWHAFTKR